jgi:hypothetical protein
MHLINRTFLKLVLLPIGLYIRMGVDASQLKAILATKLILDDRRPRPIGQTTRSKNSKPITKSTLGTMLMSALMGAFFLFFLTLGEDILTQLTIYFSLFFVLLSLTLITDFTSVLIDVRDNFILLPKPVNDKTIVVARLLHIFIHLCKIVLPMGLPGFGYMVYTQGLYGGLLFLVLILLLTAFAIFFINAVYIAILKFTTPQRFQSIITYVQIAFAIAVYGSYQLFPRMMSRFTEDELTVSNIKGIVMFPIYWMANSWKIAFDFGGSVLMIVLGLAGFIFPLISIVLVVKYLAPSFNRKLSLLSAGTTETKKLPAGKIKEGRSLAVLASRFVTFGTTEKAGFVFTWKMTARSRDFKLKVYPAMGYLVVYAFLLISNKHLSLAEFTADSQAGKWALLAALYLSVFLLTMATNQVVYSEKHKASWIYYTSPVAYPGHILAGAVKAILFKFYSPIAAIIVIASVLFAGLQILPNLVLGLSNVVLIVALLMFSGKHFFPFSASQSTNAKTGEFMRSFFILVVSGFIAFAHFLVFSIQLAVIICAVLSLIAVWLVFGSLRQMSWDKINQAYAEE